MDRSDSLASSKVSAGLASGGQIRPDGRQHPEDCHSFL